MKTLKKVLLSMLLTFGGILYSSEMQAQTIDISNGAGNGKCFNEYQYSTVKCRNCVFIENEGSMCHQGDGGGDCTSCFEIVDGPNNDYDIVHVFDPGTVNVIHTIYVTSWTINPHTFGDGSTGISLDFEEYNP